MSTFIKDPDAVLDYMVDWSDWLGSDTIATSEWIVPDDLTNTASSNTTATATVYLSGGLVGSRYTVTNRIVTAGGRTDDRSIVIQCRQR